MSTGSIDHLKLRRACIVLLFALISAVFARMIWGFVMAVFMGAILAGLTAPLCERLLRLFRGRRSIAAGATVILVIVMVVTPLILMTGIVTSQAVTVSETVKPWVSQYLDQPRALQGALSRLPYWDTLEPYRDQITSKLGELAAAASTFLVNSLSAVTRGTAGFFFDLFIMLYSMFFFLIHGRDVLDQVMRLIPLSQSEKSLFLDKFLSVSRATLKGTFIIGIVQGALGGLAFAVAGIGGAAFWGTVMAVLSIIPGVGTALVWVPAVIYLFATGRFVAAVGLLAWCAVVVGLADNFLRPVLVGKDTEMPDILVLLSTFGGLMLFGAVGIVVGPVITALFMVVWRLYDETFGDLLAGEETVVDG